MLVGQAERHIVGAEAQQVEGETVVFGADVGEVALDAMYFQSSPGQGPREQSRPTEAQNFRISAQRQLCMGMELQEPEEDGQGELG